MEWLDVMNDLQRYRLVAERFDQDKGVLIRLSKDAIGFRVIVKLIDVCGLMTEGGS